MAKFVTIGYGDRWDEVMTAGQGHAGARSSVDFYEVSLHTLE